jgi:hypothetical protein
MKPITTHIEKPADADRAALMAKAQLDLGESIDIVIRNHSDDYTARQRALYWIWVSEIAEFRGEAKLQQHTELKRQFLVQIYRRDDPEYDAMITAVIATRDKTIGRWVIQHTSITKAKKAQMYEYMTDIQHWAGVTLGLALTDPEDLMRYEEETN